MESEGSLPHSQVPATCPYLEPARSSPYLHIPLPEDPWLKPYAETKLKFSIAYISDYIETIIRQMLHFCGYDII